MLWRPFFIGTLLLGGVAHAQGRPPSFVEPDIWTVHARCAKPTRVIVEFREHKSLLHRNVLSLCHVRPADRADHVSPDSSFVLDISPALRHVYRLARLDTITADIWEASADTDAVVLGISFETKREILVNTLHVVRSTRITWQSLGGGVQVRSFPALGRQSSSDR